MGLIGIMRNESFESNFAICSYSTGIVRNKQQSTFFLHTGFAFRVPCFSVMEDLA